MSEETPKIKPGEKPFASSSSVEKKRPGNESMPIRKVDPVDVVTKLSLEIQEGHDYKTTELYATTYDEKDIQRASEIMAENPNYTAKELSDRMRYLMKMQMDEIANRTLRTTPPDSADAPLQAAEKERESKMKEFISRDEVTQIVNKYLMDIFEGNAEDIKAFKKKFTRINHQVLVTANSEHPEWSREKVLFELKSYLLRLKVIFDHSQKKPQAAAKAPHISPPASPRPGMPTAKLKNSAEAPEPSLRDLKREAVLIALSDTNESKSADEAISDVEGVLKAHKGQTFWGVLSNVVKPENRDAFNELRQKAEALEKAHTGTAEDKVITDRPPAFQENLEDEEEIEEYRPLDEIEKKNKSEAARLSLISGGEEDEITPEMIDQQVTWLETEADKRGKNFWEIAESLNSKDSEFSDKIKSLALEIQGKKKIAEDNRFEAASLPSKYEAYEYAKFKNKYDPIRNFLINTCKVNENEIGDIEYTSFVYFNKEKGERKPIPAHKYNYHDILAARAKASVRDRDMLDRLEFDLSDEDEPKRKIYITLPKKLGARFKEGDLQDFHNDLVELQWKIQDDQIPDEYASAAREGRVPLPKDLGGVQNSEKKIDEEKSSLIKRGDFVQWTSLGVDQFDKPRKVTKISDDGKWAFIEGTATGIPPEQLFVVSADSQKDEHHEVLSSTSSKEADPIKPEIKIEKSVAEKFDKFGITAEQLKGIEGFSELTSGQQKLVAENLAQLTMGRIHETAGQDFKEATAKSGVLGRIWLNATKRYKIATIEKKSAEEIIHSGLDGHQEILKQLVRGTKELGLDVHDAGGKLEIDFAAQKAFIQEGTDRLPKKENELVGRFNEAARELSIMPREWSFDSASLTEQVHYKEVQKKYDLSRKKVIELYIKNKKGSQAEAMLYLNNIESKIKLNQYFNTHPDAEEQMLKIRDQSALARGLKDIVTERGIYALGGGLLRTAAVGIAGAAAIPFAAGLSGYVFGRMRAKTELNDRAKNARRGEKFHTNTLKLEAKAEKIEKEILLKQEELEKITNLPADEFEKLSKSEKNGIETNRQILSLRIGILQEDLKKIQKKINDEKHLNKSFLSAEGFEDGEGRHVKGLNEKLLQLIGRIQNESDPQKKLELGKKLRLRLEYTEQKLDKGEVSFGEEGAPNEIGARLGDQLDILHAVAEAGLISRELGISLEKEYETKEDIQKGIENGSRKARLDQFTSRQSAKNRDAQVNFINDQALQAAMYAGVFSAAGMLIRDLLAGGHWFGGGKSEAHPSHVRIAKPKLKGHTSSHQSIPRRSLSIPPKTSTQAPPKIFLQGAETKMSPFEKVTVPEKLTLQDIPTSAQLKKVIPELSDLGPGPKILPIDVVMHQAQELDSPRLAALFESANVYRFRDGLYAASVDLKGIVDNFDRLPPSEQNVVVEHIEKMLKEINANDFSKHLDTENWTFLNSIVDRAEKINALFKIKHGQERDNSLDPLLFRLRGDLHPEHLKEAIPEVAEGPKVVHTKTYETAPPLRSGHIFPRVDEMRMPQNYPQNNASLLSAEQVILQRNPLLAQNLESLEHILDNDQKNWSFSNIDSNLTFIEADFNRFPLLLQDTIMDHIKKLDGVIFKARIGIASNGSEAEHLEHTRDMLLQMQRLHKRTHDSFFRSIAEHGFSEQEYNKKIVANHLTVRTILDVYALNQAEHKLSPFVKWLATDEEFNMADAPKDMPVDEYIRSRFVLKRSEQGILGLGRIFRR